MKRINRKELRFLIESQIKENADQLSHQDVIDAFNKMKKFLTPKGISAAQKIIRDIIL